QRARRTPSVDMLTDWGWLPRAGRRGRGASGGAAPEAGMEHYRRRGPSQRVLGYRALSRKSVSCDLDMAPTLVCTASPSLNSMSVGTPRMPNLAAVAWLSSTSTLTMFRRSPYSVATWSRMGAIILQGPHHVAVKSTSTGVEDWSTSESKLESLTCLIASLMTFPLWGMGASRQTVNAYVISVNRADERDMRSPLST